MSNDNLDFFDSKEDRNDFWTAIAVIIFFLLFFWWLLGKGVPGLDKFKKPELTAIADADGDGVSDDLDKCPNVFGLMENEGCPLAGDRDGDGVADDVDQCPNVAGARSNDGCPLDKDGDGIADVDDRCPEYPGIAANFGCPADRDGDGVHDGIDKCPNTKGVLANDGCPADRDGDGIADSVDKCPSLYGVASNNGCPKVRIDEADALVLADAMKSVEFNTAKATLKPSSRVTLDKIASMLKRYPRYKLTISGHTDNTTKNPDKAAGAQMNLELSRARAKTCYDYLVAKGISPKKMKHRGYGQTRPIEDNSTAEGRQRNRRVEFSLNY